MLTGGHNIGRVGVVTRREKHPGSFEIVHLKDSAGHTFSTRINNVFILGQGTKSLVSLPKDKGVKKSIIEEMEERIKAKGMKKQKKPSKKTTEAKQQ
jgi:Ribosomal protein S4E